MAFKFESDNSSVAQVSSSGKVTAVSPGNANIKVSTENDTDIATVKVTVTPRESDTRPAGISINKSSIKISTSGLCGILKATVLPSNAVNKTVTWTSLNPDIVSVHPRKNNTCELWDEEGAHWGPTTQNKTATIVAKTADGQTATCNVTVEVKGTIIDKVEILDANIRSDGSIDVGYNPSSETPTFKLKCYYHNVGNYYGGISLVNGEGMGSPYNARTQENGYTIIPVYVYKNIWGPITFTFSVRGQGAGDTPKVFTVHQAGSPDIWKISEEDGYFDANGKYHFYESYDGYDGIGHQYGYAQCLEYYCNPAVSKSAISDGTMIKYGNGSYHQIAFVQEGTVPDSTNEWVAIYNWVCYKYVNKRITTRTNAEWDEFIQNPPSKTMADCSFSIKVAKNTTGVARTATIKFPGGKTFSIKQGA